MQKSLSPARCPVKACVSLSGSKSISNRVLLIAACANGVSILENLPQNKDVIAGVEALKALGIPVEEDKIKNTIKITGSGGAFPNKAAQIYCNEAGTLTRFIIPLCAAQQEGVYTIDAAPRMKERPIQDQLKVLHDLGMTAEYLDVPNRLPMKIHAKGLQSKPVSVFGGKSSQFLSGILIAAPYIEGGLEVHSQTDHPQPYVEMTLAIMKQFGVTVEVLEVDENRYYVPYQEGYRGAHYYIEPDISTASYFWAAAALTQGEVRILNVTKNAIQGDIQFLSVLQKMGCTIVEEDNAICVIGPRVLKGVSVNMRNFSDTFMTLVALACFADSETHISGLTHTRGQESDRVSAMVDGLTKLGVYTEETEDSIHIYPDKSNLKSAVVQGYNDHRIAMSLALIGLRQEGVVVDGAECVAKTCPDYFERMNKMFCQ
ncbi:3-phosphoshikimate 1-carboxyvinyltransferase [Fangia hongkongensis]|uniref:3-phosphoshikimate 1-carboxyvinyltransferase n=2 Tax=Fangia hongkongensis TaxID=270495 RepID=UPI0003637ED9|nr:3-phosphoshikimate 1-carboxyvinyltransferase [Fangia hongkongensis]